MELGFSTACATYPTLSIMFVGLSVLLLLRHCWKHQHDLHGTDVCFQPEDVYVLCEHRRTSHEMFVVLCWVAAYVLMIVYANRC